MAREGQGQESREGGQTTPQWSEMMVTRGRQSRLQGVTGTSGGGNADTSKRGGKRGRGRESSKNRGNQQTTPQPWGGERDTHTPMHAAAVASSLHMDSCQEALIEVMGAEPASTDKQASKQARETGRHNGNGGDSKPKQAGQAASKRSM